MRLEVPQGVWKDMCGDLGILMFATLDGGACGGIVRSGRHELSRTPIPKTVNTSASDELQSSGQTVGEPTDPAEFNSDNEKVRS